MEGGKDGASTPQCHVDSGGLFGCSLVAEAAPGYSVKDVDGATTFDFDGFVIMGGTAVPVASMGRFVADGNGNITDGVRTLVVGGTTIRQTFSCTYNVNVDGTGDATCAIMTSGVPSGTETFDFVIVERKKESFFTGTSPGVTIRGRTQRQQ